MIRLVESRRRGEVCSGGLGRGPSVRGVVCGAAYRVGGVATSPRMRSGCRCVVSTVLGLSAAAGAASAPPRHAQSLSYSGPHARVCSSPYCSSLLFLPISLTFTLVPPDRPFLCVAPFIPSSYRSLYRRRPHNYRRPFRAGVLPPFDVPYRPVAPSHPPHYLNPSDGLGGVSPPKIEE